MGLSNNLANYADIKAVFDAVGDRPTASLQFPTYGKAINWRQRAYKFKQLVLENETSKFSSIAGYIARTDYDAFVMQLDKQATIIFITRQGQTVSALLDEDGKPIPINWEGTKIAAEESAGDELLLDVISLVKGDDEDE